MSIKSLPQLSYNDDGHASTISRSASSWSRPAPLTVSRSRAKEPILNTCVEGRLTRACSRRRKKHAQLMPTSLGAQGLEELESRYANRIPDRS